MPGEGGADELARLEIPDAEVLLLCDGQHLGAPGVCEMGAAGLSPELARICAQCPDPLPGAGLPDLEDVVVGVPDGAHPRGAVACREPGDHLHLVQLFDEPRCRARLRSRIPDPDGVVAGRGGQERTSGRAVEGGDGGHLEAMAAQRHPHVLAGRAVRDPDVVLVRGRRERASVGVRERGLPFG